VSSPPNLLTSRFGDGLAADPDLAAAAESAVTQALAPLHGQRPDLLCVFVCGDDPEMVELAGTRAMALAGARTTLGTSAGGVIGAGRGVEGVPAVSAFAACLPGVRCTPMHLELVRTLDGAAVTGMPDRREDDAVAVLLADPYTFPVTDFVQRSHDDLNGLPLIHDQPVHQTIRDQKQHIQQRQPAVLFGIGGSVCHRHCRYRVVPE